MRVAFLGAGGIMGLAMSGNLAGAGIDVRAWNRTREKAAPLEDEGIELAGTPAEAAAGAGVVLTMLSDTDAVMAAMDGDDGAAGAVRPGTTWLQMSTIGIDGTERCAELAERRELTFVDAPVVGTKQPAEQGKLVVLGSGPPETREQLQPVFDAVAQRVLWAGDAGAGTRLKLVANSWIVSVVEGAAETLALAEGLGLDPQLFFQAIEGGPLDLPYLRNKGRAMLERSFEPSFRLALGAKDARLVEEAAERHGLDLPMLAAISRRLEEGVADHGDDDLSATFMTSVPQGA